MHYIETTNILEMKEVEQKAPRKLDTRKKLEKT